MKKFISILFLFILCFNIIGYKFVANYFEHKAINDLQISLDQHHYNESELISFKLPLHLPYYNHSGEFESVEGNIEIDGISYQYVKKRVYNDTLEIKCIPNFEKSDIKNKKEDFAKQINDIAIAGQPKKAAANKLVKLQFSDYSGENSFLTSQLELISKTEHRSKRSCFTCSDFLQSLYQPPEA